MTEPWNVCNAKLGAGGLVIHQDQILLVQVNYGPAKGKWILPGGRVENNELLIQSVEREVFEETGVKAKTEGLVGFRQRVLPNGNLDIYFLFRLEATTIPNQLGGDPKEILDARFWKITEALTHADVRPMTKLAIRLTLEKSTLLKPVDLDHQFPGSDSVIG